MMSNRIKSLILLVIVIITILSQNEINTKKALKRNKRAIPPAENPPFKKTDKADYDKMKILSREFCQTNCWKDSSASYKPCYHKPTQQIKSCTPCKLSKPVAKWNEEAAIAICKNLCLSVENYQCDFYGFNSKKAKAVPAKYLEKFNLKIVRRRK